MATARLESIPSLHRYRSATRSGVSAYAVLVDAIVVEFRDGSLYLYNQDCPGRRHVERMQALADDGVGLASYISRRVGKRFAACLRAGTLAAQSSARQSSSVSPAPGRTPP